MLQDTNPSDGHLIGLSLTAHTLNGEKLNVNIGRITGLDPAKPHFHGIPSHLPLDFTDAQLVDVIYTDGKSIFFLGTLMPLNKLYYLCSHHAV